MAVTDQALLSEVQRATLEGTGDGGATWPSGMWTQAEVLGYLTQRQNRWLAQSALLWTVGEVAVVADQADQDVPEDWIATLLVAARVVEDAVAGYREVPIQDTFELDQGQTDWSGLAASTTPVAYYELGGATRTGYLVPPPTADVEALEYYYVALGAVLDASGVDLSVPDEYVPTLKAGVLADLFSKVGEGQNLPLARRCEARWDEGIQIARLQAAAGWLAL